MYVCSTQALINTFEIRSTKNKTVYGKIRFNKVVYWLEYKK